MRLGRGRIRELLEELDEEALDAAVTVILEDVDCRRLLKALLRHGKVSFHDIAEVVVREHLEGHVQP